MIGDMGIGGGVVNAEAFPFFLPDTASLHRDVLTDLKLQQAVECLRVLHYTLECSCHYIHHQDKWSMDGINRKLRSNRFIHKQNIPFEILLLHLIGCTVRLLGLLDRKTVTTFLYIFFDIFRTKYLINF